MRLFFCIFLLFPAICFCEEIFTGKWFVSSNNKTVKTAKDTDGNAVYITHSFPGNILISVQKDRYTFRPSIQRFNASILSMKVKPVGYTGLIKAWLYIQDKDGAWYQTEKEFHLKSGEWNELEVPIDASSRSFLPMGHQEVWSSWGASSAFSVGINIYSENPGQGRFYFQEPVFSGQRGKKDLSILNWNLPETGRVHEIICSRFNLSREYFNPFDPDEITVDFEVKTPSGALETYPAFYNMDCREYYHFTQEKVELIGPGFWEFRFNPKQKGIHHIRIKVTDKTGKKTEMISSFQRRIMINDSNYRGFVRVSKKNPWYFEFENGEFFYPVGLNIHSNTDERGENAFGYGHLPDRGNADYREYIDSLSKNGMQLMEVWMAAWTYAIEWSAAYPHYYGVGRYNMINAWKLDRLLDYARKKGVYVNLVLDNHGKVSDVCDPEWHYNPFNTKNVYAKANGAFLDGAEKYWTNAEMLKYLLKRDRYIAARWGADPIIFSMQLWSEVNLVTQAWGRYADGNMGKVHVKQADFLKKHTQGKCLNATHVCGDGNNTIAWRKVMMDLPQMTHICSDAYRDTHIPIYQQMRIHRDIFMKEKKPVMVTEFGGTSGGSSYGYQIADIHGGLWSSPFCRQAAGPLLWWHDFVHINNLYPHYYGFTQFMKGGDLREGRLEFSTLSPKCEPFIKNEKYKLSDFTNKKTTPSKLKFIEFPDAPFNGYLLLQNGRFALGWIYHQKYLHLYPHDLKNIIRWKNCSCRFDSMVPAGGYTLFFYDTMTCRLVTSVQVVMKKKDYLRFNIPAPEIDIAFKMYRSCEL